MLVTVLVVVGLAAAGIGALAWLEGCPDFKAAALTHGRLFRAQGGWVLTLDGDPAQRGAAAGELLGPQIRWLLPRYLKASVGRSELTPYLRRLVQRLERRIPGAQRQQLRALARAAGVAHDDLLAVNLAPEAFAALACSCLGVAPQGGPHRGAALARNLDWNEGGLLDGLDLIVVEGGPEINGRFASMTWPGLVGVVTGLNSHGVAAANLVVLGRRRPIRSGVPALFVVRTALESSTTAPAAAAAIRRLERATCQNYALADADDTRVLETCPDHVRVRTPDRYAVAIANSQREDRDTLPNSRYSKMLQAASAPLSVTELKALMARVALGKLNIQAAIILPRGRIVHLATQGRPAAAGPWRRIDLSRLLNR